MTTNSRATAGGSKDMQVYQQLPTDLEQGQDLSTPAATCNGRSFKRIQCNSTVIALSVVIIASIAIAILLTINMTSTGGSNRTYMPPIAPAVLHPVNMTGGNVHA